VDSFALTTALFFRKRRETEKEKGDIKRGI
jgi:hypothetical protein